MCTGSPFCTREAAWSIILSLGTKQAPPLLVCDVHREQVEKQAKNEGVVANLYPLAVVRK